MSTGSCRVRPAPRGSPRLPGTSVRISATWHARSPRTWRTRSTATSPSRPARTCCAGSGSRLTKSGSSPTDGGPHVNPRFLAGCLAVLAACAVTGILPVVILDARERQPALAVLAAVVALGAAAVLANAGADLWEAAG